MQSKKTHLQRKKELLKMLNKSADNMIIGSLYQTKVNCRIKTCKKCQNGEKGHLANHLGYQISKGNHKTTYISENIVSEVKKNQELYKSAKKLLMDIAEINLLIFKAKE